MEQQLVEGRNYINGGFVARCDGGEYENINPATGQVLGSFCNSTSAEVSKAYKTAREAFNKWKPKPKYTLEAV